MLLIGVKLPIALDVTERTQISAYGEENIT